MKMVKPLTSAFLVLVAATVTVGSMYVTVSAASNPGSDEFIVPLPAVDAGEQVPNEDQLVGMATPLESLPAEDIRSDRTQGITIDEAGGFTGTVSELNRQGDLVPVAGMTVRIIRDGVVVASTTSGNDGSYSFTGLEEGVVALLAYSDTSFLLYGCKLERRANVFAAADATPVKYDSFDLAISSAVVSGADLSVAKGLIYGALPSGRQQRFESSLTDNDHEFDHGEGEQSSSTKYDVIELQPDGTLLGHLNLLDPRSGRHREVVDLTIHFIRDGQLVASTEVARSGDFQVVGLAPGVHSLVTTGEDGILVLGIDVVAAQPLAQKDGSFTYVGVGKAQEFSAAPANAENFNASNANQVSGNQGGNNQPPGQGTPPGTPPPGGAAGGAPAGGAPAGGTGTTGGGGGVPGGGGGLGGLLGALAGGALGYLAGDNNGNNLGGSPVR